MVKVFVGDTKSYLGKSLVPVLVGDGHEVITWDEKQAVNFASIATADVAILDVVRNPEQTEAVLKFLKDKELENDLMVIGVSNVMSWCRSKNSDDKPLHESAYKTRKTSLQYKPIKLLETLVLSAAKPRLSTFVICSGICYGAGEEEWKELFRIGWCCEQKSLTLVGDGSNVIPMIHIADLSKVIATVVKEPPAGLQFIVATDNSRTTQKGLVEAINKGLGPGTPIQILAKDDEKVLLAGAALPSAPATGAPAAAAATAAASGIGLPNPASGSVTITAGSGGASTSLPAAGAGATAASDIGTGANAEIVLADMRFDTGPDSDSYVSKLLEPGSVMQWTAAEGIASVMETVRAEFVKTRGLRPIRMAVHGPPGSGKTYYAEKLASHYYLPHIKIADVIKEVLDRKESGDPLAEEVAKALTPIVLDAKAAAKLKAKLLKQAQTAQKAGKKKPTASLASLMEPSAPRLPLPLLTRVLKQKLRSSACRNKGFVLDGFPRNAAEARFLFGPDSLLDPDAPPYDPADDYEDDDAADEAAAAAAAAEEEAAHAAAVAAAVAAGEDGSAVDHKSSARSSARPKRRERKVKRDDTTMVQYVISLSCSEEVARARFMKLDEKQIIPKHNDQDGFERRWTKYEEIYGPSEHKNLGDGKPADSGTGLASGKKDAVAADEKKAPAPAKGAAARAAAAAAAAQAQKEKEKEREREAAAAAAAAQQFNEDGTPIVSYPGETESALDNLSRDIDVLDVGLEVASNPAQAFNLMCVYLERGGKPFNYHPTAEEKRIKEAEAVSKAAEVKSRADADSQQKQASELADRAQKERKHSERQQQVLMEDQQLVEQLSVPLRKYLMANVIPALVDGLLDVCNKQPDDPIDHLAEFLFKHATGTREPVKFQDATPQSPSAAVVNAAASRKDQKAAN